MTILFSCAGRRNYLLRYFKEVVGKTGTIIAVDSDPTASAFSDADIALQVPSVTDSEYLSTLETIVSEYDVDMLIPLNDWELFAISSHREQFENLGTRVVVSSPEIVQTFTDKWQTYQFFKKIGVNTPETYLSLNDAEEALNQEKIKFPLVLKPRVGSGSINVMVANSWQELKLVHQLLSSRMKFLDNENNILIQEKIVGIEYGMDILNDFEGKYFGSYVRQKIAMRCGETDKAISVIEDRFDRLAKDISKSTQHIGSVDCDFFVVDEKVYLLEINPRFGGGYPFSHEAGINIPAIYCAWHEGRSDISTYCTYRSNMAHSKCSNLKLINTHYPEQTKAAIKVLS